jgi:choline dehydrogenase-like flavoprotein
VSPNFTLYDFNNLFVADASLFPAGCGVNPQMTTMALAHLAAEWM